MNRCYALLFSGILVLAGCEPFGREATLSVIVPQPPLVWLQAFPALGCRVVYPDQDGVIRCVDEKDWTQTITISCSKSSNTPVLAFPITMHDAQDGGTRGGYLRPAGGLYPFSLEVRPGKETLLLSWEQGALASVMARLQGAGRDVSLFNAARLAAYLERASDPWTLDLDRVTQLIASGDFQADDIHALPHHRVLMSCGPGAWFLESPLSPAVQSIEGVLELPAVSEGARTLFSTDGGMIRFQVNQEGIVLMPSEAGNENGATLRRAVRGQAGSISRR